MVKYCGERGMCMTDRVWLVKVFRFRWLKWFKFLTKSHMIEAESIAEAYAKAVELGFVDEIRLYSFTYLGKKYQHKQKH